MPDDDQIREDARHHPAAIVLKEGGVPPFPASAHVEGLAEGDKASIAEAAWKQAFGSIAAFEQMCAEHARREIDLLTGKTPAELADERRAPAPLTADEEARRVELSATPNRSPAQEAERTALQARVVAAEGAAGV